MEQTSARLRKTFRYPVDGDEDDDLPEALDEEEQESLIRTLNAQNANLNNQYRLALFAIPLLSILPYLTTLLKPHLTLLSFLSITSLLSTTYLLHALPPSQTGLAFLDNLTRQQQRPPSRSRAQRLQEPDDGPILTYLLHALPPSQTGLAFLDNLTRQQQRPPSRSRAQRLQEPDDGPILTYLPYLNIALCSMLALLGAVAKRKVAGELWTGFSWLPAGVYGVVLLAKWIMGSVDPEAELGELKYEFKSA